MEGQSEMETGAKLKVFSANSANGATVPLAAANATRNTPPLRGRVCYLPACGLRGIKPHQALAPSYETKI